MAAEQQVIPPVYMTADDFLADAEDCLLVQEVFAELEANATQDLLDESLRRQEDWNILAYQVVGAEQHR